uniref:Dual oxidase maturation factor 1-like n=1 Tax=Heterorhabditis bacteriophora TaxID=37862 RepID=A0A1I7W6Z6_HETBA
MHWWFQLFREYGDPIQYGPQHTPVTIDPYISTIAFGFTVPVISYLLILPGIKFKKVHSSMSFLFCMLVGATILISLYHPCWNKAEARIVSLYKACSTERLGANLLVRVGLHHVNITMDIHRMKEELPKALRKGLPYPILKVIEYISNDAFGWGKQYRHVGYYTSSALWTAVGFWVMSIVSLGFLPQYYSRTILSTGIVTVVGNASCFVY